VINRRNGFSATLFKKGLTENHWQRRGQAAQRLQHNGFV